MKKVNNSGFTIIEVLISTIIFTALLTMVIVIILNFSNSYFKEVNSSTTQSSSRTLLNHITQAIEFSNSVSSAPEANNTFAYCMGSVQFDFNNAYGPSSPNTLWETSEGSGDSCSTFAPDTTSQFLLGPQLQILGLQICVLGAPPGPNCLSTSVQQPTYQINLVVSYGADNLICDTAQYPNCPLTGMNSGLSGLTYANNSSDTFQCVRNIGGKFCDVVSLTAITQARI